MHGDERPSIKAIKVRYMIVTTIELKVLLVQKSLLHSSFFILYCVCRGFGFVTYIDPSCMDKVLADGPHNIDGKKVRLCICKTSLICTPL